LRSIFLLIIMICFVLQACENKIKPSVIPKAASESPSYLNNTEIIQSSNPDPAASTESNTIDLGVINEDLDNDGKSEQIRLIYDANLKLQMGYNSIVVTSDLPNLEETNSHTYWQKPAISVLQTDTKQKAILVSIVWSTNKIGSTAELWIYEYQSKAMKMIWNSGDFNPQGKAEYHQKTQSVSVQFPDYGINQNIVLDENQKQWISKLAETPSEHEALLSDLTEYKVTLTPDGQSELMTKRLVAFDSAPYYISPLYTYYRIEKGKVVALRANLDRSEKADAASDTPSQAVK
jgi:hypothetical protein